MTGNGRGARRGIGRKPGPVENVSGGTPGRVKFAVFKLSVSVGKSIGQHETNPQNRQTSPPWLLGTSSPASPIFLLSASHNNSFNLEYHTWLLPDRRAVFFDSQPYHMIHVKLSSAELPPFYDTCYPPYSKLSHNLLHSRPPPPISPTSTILLSFSSYPPQSSSPKPMVHLEFPPTLYQFFYPLSPLIPSLPPSSSLPNCYTSGRTSFSSEALTPV